MSAAEARQVLRTLLRAVDRNITGITGNRQWREFAVAEFRRGAALADPAERQAALQAAKDYAFLITSVREHKVRRVKATGWGRGLAARRSSASCRRRLVLLLTLLSLLLSPGCPALPLQELLLSYNIGISSEHREKGMNTRAANLVGLQMPAMEENFEQHQKRTQ